MRLRIEMMNGDQWCQDVPEFDELHSYLLSCRLNDAKWLTFNNGGRALRVDAISSIEVES